MIYLDNAATTFPKPISVIEEIKRCVAVYGGNPGRGSHSLSLSAARKVFECRNALAELFGAADTDRVFFTLNTTHGINTVIKGLLKHGDHVIISDMEHNAVFRPIYKLATEGMIEYDVFETLTGDVCENIERLIRKNTKLVFCTHASNICSRILPIKRIGELCRRYGILFCVDAAQSAGHTAIDVSQMGIDALCVPGHKGLYGPQGCGAVILGEGITLETLTEGGNGVDSLAPDMTLQAPERYEAGTLPTPAISGLCEGVRALRARGIDEIAGEEGRQCARLYEVIGNLRGVTLYAPEYVGSIVLFNVDGVPSERVASMLDKHGVCVRGGYHCTALAHHTLNTPDGGAVRASLGMFNRTQDVDAFYRALKNVMSDLC